MEVTNVDVFRMVKENDVEAMGQLLYDLVIKNKKGGRLYLEEMEDTFSSILRAAAVAEGSGKLSKDMRQLLVEKLAGYMNTFAFAGYMEMAGYVNTETCGSAPRSVLMNIKHMGMPSPRTRYKIKTMGERAMSGLLGYLASGEVEKVATDYSELIIQRIYELGYVPNDRLLEFMAFSIDSAQCSAVDGLAMAAIGGMLGSALLSLLH